MGWKKGLKTVTTEAKRRRKKKKLGEMEKCYLYDDKDETKELYPGFSNMGVTDQSHYDRAISPPQGVKEESGYEGQRRVML